MGYLWKRYHTPSDRSNVITDKNRCAETYAGYFYTRLLKMFKYEGLPETISQDVLEYYLLSNGSCFITEVEVPNDREEGTQVGVDNQENKLFAFIGDRVVIAHNADFDTGFVREACKQSGIPYELTSVDTLVLSQCMLQKLHRHKYLYMRRSLPPRAAFRASSRRNRTTQGQ